MKRHQATAEEGRQALQGHLADKALEARARHGPAWSAEALGKLLEDDQLVRFPTRLVFDDEPLLSGEFAWARPRGDRPGDGFDLVVHPQLKDRPDDLALAVAYHLPSINYLDVASREEAELFGATLLGLDVDTYYARLCALADGLPGASPPDPQAAVLVAEAEAQARQADGSETSGHGCGTTGVEPAPESRTPCSSSCGCATPAREPAPAPRVTSALVVSLETRAAADELRRRLAGSPAFEVGAEPEDTAGAVRLPLVMECVDSQASEEQTRWLRDQPGVAAVDVIVVGFPEAGEPAEEELPR